MTEHPLPITRPTLVLDRRRAERNIERMVRRAEGVHFRPHFKTHQAAEIGEWFRALGVRAITVSSLAMARYFARHGWSDITVAFPINLLEMDALNALAIDIDLGVVVDSERAIEGLDADLVAHARAWIKVDTGYGRVGVPWSEGDRIAAMAGRLKESPALRFEGVLTHSGHSYRASSTEEIREIHRAAVERLGSVRETVLASGIPACSVSIGDTPTCSLAEDFAGVDEIRPGNFVFNDLTQVRLGVCSEEAIAVAVACPVVGKYEPRREIAVYGGAVHLSKEYLEDGQGRRVFGALTAAGRDSLGPILWDAPVVSITQEHGIIRMDEALFSETEIGDVVYILPVHSCLTCNLHREYRTLDGHVIHRR